MTEHSNGIAGVQLAVSDSKGTGTLNGTTTATTSTTGASSFMVAPKQGGSQTLTVGTGVLTATSNTFNVTPVAPTVMLTVNPTQQTYGAPVASGTFTGSPKCRRPFDQIQHQQIRQFRP